MKQDSTDFLAKLEAIKSEYVTLSLPGQISDILEKFDTLKSSPVDAGNFNSARDMNAVAHKLTGSSGVLGLDEISSVSSKICKFTDCARKKTASITPKNLDKIASLVDQLCQLADQATQQVHDQNQILDVNATNDTVVILCNKNSNTATFAEKFITQEFNIVLLENATKVHQAIIKHQAQIVVVDLQMDGESVCDEQELQKLKTLPNHEVSIIFVSTQTDMIARLAAVRAGGEAFVVAPFEHNELMDTIDRLMDKGMNAPIRVLIVVDNDEFIRITSTSVEGAGMICQVARNPIEVQNALATFVPEMILMDISMPGCTGLELGEVILQQEQFVGTPIIFLSEERRSEMRKDEVRQGSYNFMAKPVDIVKLTGIIREQALKFRSMRSRMIKDSLTGLNNHSMTRRLLEHQMDNARRTKSALSFAMIDIDHFKKVNDTHGHAMGDQVLRSLSRLLKQRFRSNDVVGRLGGEEFGVVISGTNGPTSKVICDQVRISFSETQFGTGDNKFSCKISIGIAEFPSCNSSSEIMESADKALYVAKESGRDQVILSSPDTK